MSNLILLTGSGFTMNFDGFSNDDIKKVIKSQLTDEKLKNRIDKNPYEQIYQELNSTPSTSSFNFNYVI